MTHRALAIIFSLLALPTLAQETKTLQDFESPADLRTWDFKQKSASLSDQHATHGQHALRISASEYMNSFRLPRDWSGHDALELDIFVEGDAPVSGSLLIADEPWQKSGGTYWNRHNGSFNLRPGANTLSIPVNGLYRGEAGSRNHDLPYNIDPKQIIRLDLGFKTKSANPTWLYLDNLRLTKESRPAGILAFDLGPADQTVSPGFTPIGPTTVHGKNGKTAGLDHAGSDGFARDDTFPTRLYRDDILMDGFTFVADVPEKSGTYHAWVMYNDLGYWGGEQATYRTRKIIANNQPAVSEDRKGAGPTDYLFHFESVEPHPGDNLWDTYMSYLFTPRRFTCKAENGQIRLKFNADAGQSCKVAAIILYPDSIKAEAEKWLADVERRNRNEFESRAVFLGPQPKPLNIPADAKQKGYWLGFPTLEQDVTFADAPASASAADAMPPRDAAQGQRLSFTFAVRPLRDFPAPAQFTATDLKSTTGQTLPASKIDLRYVHHALHRNFNDIAYTIGPDTLRPLTGANLKLTKNLTRQFWITLHVPDNTPAGRYTSTLTLTAGDLRISLPLTVNVLPFKLDEPDFAMGFFGTSLPQQIRQSRGEDAWRELFTTLRQAGMNSFSGGPAVHFSGLDAKGKPLLDFTAVDHFMKLAREAGFTKELNAYGGPGMVSGLHDSYVIGQTGRDWEKRTGKPFPELLKIVWSAVRDHAREHNWLPIAYEFTDEPRVLEQANEQLELMKLYRENVPFVNIGGSYSVDWNKSDPFDQAVQEIFKTLAWSSLNLHTQTDLDMANKFHKALYIYNQGRTRYSFGAYQWAEMHKGIKGRMQWHLLALHGYQFFDLDGREPDTAMINWTSHGILPTISLARCREGADDFRFATTLYNRAQKQNTPAAKDALNWLEQINTQIPVGHNTAPKNFNDESFRNQCIEKLIALTSEQAKLSIRQSTRIEFHSRPFS